MARILVFAATYNEADNIKDLVKEIFLNLPNQEVLIVDDDSPDGTGKILDKMSKEDPRIHVIHRLDKLGLGSAHILAMKYALHHEYDFLITMDADFSHHPKYLPEIVENLRENDFVIGSRYIEGGYCDYGLIRSAISKTANFLTRLLLGIKLHETTTSYRGFSIDLLKKMNLNALRHQGYSFFVESIFCVTQTTKKTKEIPIYFEDRRAGTSKISKTEIIKGAVNLFIMFIKRLFPEKENKADTSIPTVPVFCEICKSRFHMVLYPRKHPGDENSYAYQCTSKEHSSHGRIVRCLQCGLVFDATHPEAEQVLKYYSEVEDTGYLKNIDSRKIMFEHNFSRIKSLLPKSGKLLDVGSYCGVFLKIAENNGYDTLGVEPSEWAAQYSREKMGQEAIAGTLKDVPPDKGNFDVITMWDVMEHLPHPMNEIALIKTRMKPNGIFAFATLNIDNWAPRFLKEKWPWFMDMHLYYFDKKSIGQMLKKNHLEIIDSQSYRHIITLEYFFLKLDSLGLRGARHLSPLIAKSPLKNTMIPFYLGDIQMFVCKAMD
jgi:dolichol-phosphate mannosyltransferase